jgi:Wadjet protein JetD, C-terminal
MTPLAAAMAAVLADQPRRRVPLTTLLAAAAAVDRTGAVSVGWRSRGAAAIGELADAGIVEVPRTRWDTTAEPPLPAYVTRPAAPEATSTGAEAAVWHAELGWAAELDAVGKLNDTERQFLVSVNAWLPRRPETVVPQRERSLDICGDEKALDAWVLTPLFAPDRLTYERLRCRSCWPPVHQEILGPGPWLVIENWTTYRTLADAARRHGWDGRLVWGAGNQVGTRLSSLAATEGAPIDGLRYFGDIDTAGFRIARMAASRAETLGLAELLPAGALYRMCCDVGTIRTTANRAGDDLRRWTRDWLGGTLGRVAAEIIAGGGRIVQETVGVELLNTIDGTQLLGR